MSLLKKDKYKRKRINSRNLPSNIVLTRLFLIEALPNLPIKDVKKVAPNFVNVYEEIDEKGTTHIMVELDYRWIIYYSRLEELNKLFSNFIPKKKIITPKLIVK